MTCAPAALALNQSDPTTPTPSKCRPGPTEHARTRLFNSPRRHKTANVLNKVPKSVQRAMKADLREIHAAPTRAQAEAAMAAMAVFAEKYGIKYARVGRVLGQGSRGAAGLLRPACRALGPSSDYEPHRERVRHGAASRSWPSATRRGP